MADEDRLYIDISKIEDKKITCIQTNQELIFSDVWKKLEKDQLVFVVLFRRFGCIFCKNSAIELSIIGEKIQKRFPNKIKFIGIGIDENNLEEWIKEKYFKYPMYINKKRTIYKALKLKSPNCLSGFGFCQKNVFKTLDKISTTDRTKNLKTNYNGGDNFQLGGSLLISNKGSIEFTYIDSFYGDHASEEQILEAIETYEEENN